MKRKTVCITSLGCPRNLVDTEVMIDKIIASDIEITDSLKQADYHLVNTCGFIEEAREETIESIQEIMNRKKKSAKVIVTGCMVQNQLANLKKLFPNVHYFLGAGDIDSIVSTLHSEEKGELISDKKSYLETLQDMRRLATPPNYAFLKIAEGCLKRCSYCAIPNIKGPLRSKPISQVVKEFQTLLDQNVFEIILIAQDLGDYGKDLSNTDLSQLLKELLKIKRPYWLRLLYLYPDRLDDELIHLIASDKRILPYVDMPLQHIDDKILCNMKRSTSQEKIKSIIKKLRKNVPDIVIRTSLMVGFPGESEEQFLALKQFVEEIELDHVGVFSYSKEEDTKAASFSDQVPEAIKEQRKNILIATQQKIAENKMKQFIGQKLFVFIEGYHKDSDLLLVGRSYLQAPDVDNQIIINDISNVDRFYEPYLVEITQIAGTDLVGNVLSPIDRKELV